MAGLVVVVAQVVVAGDLTVWALGVGAVTWLVRTGGGIWRRGLGDRAWLVARRQGPGQGRTEKTLPCACEVVHAAGLARMPASPSGIGPGRAAVTAGGRTAGYSQRWWSRHFLDNPSGVPGWWPGPCCQARRVLLVFLGTSLRFS